MVSLNLQSPEISNIDEFLAAAHRRRYPRGSTIIYAGEQSDSIYYITKGSVTVLIEDESGREIIVAYLNEFDFFGEMGLFQQGTRTAWYKAKTDCEVELCEVQRTVREELGHAVRTDQPGCRTPQQDDQEGG